MKTIPKLNGPLSTFWLVAIAPHTQEYVDGQGKESNKI